MSTITPDGDQSEIINLNIYAPGDQVVNAVTGLVGVVIGNDFSGVEVQWRSGISAIVPASELRRL